MAMIVPGEVATSRTYQRARLTVNRYLRMLRAGVFAEDDPVFLWKGELAAKLTKDQPHVIALTSLRDALAPLVPAGWHVVQESPMQVGDDSLPEPDLIVPRGRLRDYRDDPPTSRDVALVVEVADSSLAIDQGEVLESYATEEIPVYWIANLPARRIQVYTEPTGPADRPTYRRLLIYLEGDAVPVVLDGREVGRIAVADVLP